MLKDICKGRSGSSWRVANTVAVYARQCSNVLLLPRNWFGTKPALAYGYAFLAHLVPLQVIRNDGELPPHLEAARLQFASPVMRSRSEGLANMRLQWAREKAQNSSSQ